jgi:formiminotetrahydrofolate cyclodeaminase
VVGLAEAIAGRSNRNASSDLEVAATLALAAAKSAAANVEVNLPAIEDEPAAGNLLARTVGLVDETERMADRVREVVRSGESRAPLPAAGA